MIPSSSHVTCDDGAASSIKATKPSVSAAVNATGVKTLSVSELRTGMEQFLRTSGALGLLKTQLRSVIVSELWKRQGNSLKAATTQVGLDELHEDGGEATDDGESNAWTQRLADALVENHLRQTGRSFSLAIFSSEADVSFRSGEDGALAELLHFNSSAASLALQKGTSLLQSVVEAHLRTVGDGRGRHSGYAVGTQTDACDNDLTPPSLELRLAAVDAKYALCFARLGESTREEVDRRMSAYRQELQVQMEREYQQRLRAFEQERLLETRREAEDHYALLLRQKMEELHEVQQTSTQRIAAERARLTQARDDVELQRTELERRHRELQGLLEERDKATTLMETRLNDAKQQIRVLTAQVQQLEDVCSVRLAEAEGARDREWRRVEDIRRLQAEHAAELQLKDEEISRLRFRIKSILAAHDVVGRLEDVNKETTATAIQEAIIKGATALQQGVAVAQNWPQRQQLREAAALRFAWQPETLSHLTTGVAADRQERPAERQVTPQPVPPVVQGSVCEKGKGLESMEFTTSSSAAAAAVSSSFNQSNFVSAFVSKNPLPAPTQPQQLEEGLSAEDGEGRAFDEVEHTLDKRDNCGNNSGSSEKEVKTPLGGSYASLMPKSGPRRSDRSVDEKENARRSSLPSSSSSSSSSSSLLARSHGSDLVRVDENVAGSATIKTATAAAGDSSVLRKKHDILCSEESGGRANINEEEEKARHGILWTVKSQHAVLLQRQVAEREQNRTNSLPATLSLEARIAQAHQLQQQQQQATERFVITSESDNDAYSEFFNKAGSSDGSF